MSRSHTSSRAAGRSFWTVLLIGVGIMAAVDEIVFHQLLSWHHFYDGSTPDVALLSDGLLHAAELLAVAGGFFLYADLRRDRALSARFAWAGFFTGAGAFQIFDGLVDHKLLRLHQVRYGVELLPYDLAWNMGGLVLLIVGLLLLGRAQAVARGPAASTPEDQRAARR